MHPRILSSNPVEHSGPELLAEVCPEDPWELVAKWLEHAADTFQRMKFLGRKQLEWNAAQLSTVDAAGYPWCRTVLVKEASTREGFMFFTGNQSRKATQLGASGGKCSLLFYWPWISRQLLIVGHAEELSKARVMRWWASRSLLSCATALAATQSSLVPDLAAWKVAVQDKLRLVREALGKHPGLTMLEAKCEELRHVTGFGVQPCLFEFWQGQPARGHNRVLYQRDDEVNLPTWSRMQLAP